MAQDIVIAGVTYPSVPQIDVPKAGGGTASFIDATVEDITLTYSNNNYISSTEFAKFKMRKWGKLVVLSFDGEITLTSTSGSTSYRNIGTFPSANAPQEDVNVYVPLRSTSYYGAGIRVYSTGSIALYHNNTNVSKLLIPPLVWLLP